MQYKKDDTVTFLVDGEVVSGPVKKIRNDAMLEVEVGDQLYIVPPHLLGPRMTGSGGILVDGLQPDPPEAIARLAMGRGHAVLPSPVAPETKKTFYD